MFISKPTWFQMLSSHRAWTPYNVAWGRDGQVYFGVCINDLTSTYSNEYPLSYSGNAGNIAFVKYTNNTLSWYSSWQDSDGTGQFNQKNAIYYWLALN